MLNFVLIFSAILIIESTFTNELKSHKNEKRIASILLKAEKSDALDNFVRKLPQRNLRSINGTKRYVKQEILTPNTINDEWNFGSRDTEKDNDREWILCQIVTSDSDICENCELCNNVIRVQTRIRDEYSTEEEILNRNMDDLINIKTNARFRPKIIRKKRPKKTIVSPSFGKRDKGLLEKLQKDRENETMTILKVAYRESRISLKEYLTMLNNLVFLSNKPLLRINGPLATINDENDLNIHMLGRTVPKMATEDSEKIVETSTISSTNIHDDDTTIQM